MEKTPRRSAPPIGSVVVDPSSQVPAGPSSSRGAGVGAVRRKAETTLVLQARRVDSLRRQVVERQRVELVGRRRQIVLWACAGAGAVLLGGWLATRLSPRASDRDEAPLVLGRSEDDGQSATLSPPAPVDAGEAAARARADTPSAVKTVRAGTSPNQLGSAPADGLEPVAAGQDRAAAESGTEGAAERSPDEPKVVGDWGDGFDSSGNANGPSRGTQSGSRKAPAGADAVNLDDLPTE